MASVYSMTEVVLGWDNNYQIHIPDDVSNTLIEMGPGLGYWVKSNSDSHLVYPGWLYPDAFPKQGTQTRIIDRELIASNSWMSLYGSNIKVDDIEIDNNSIIEAFSTTGTLCGSGIYKNGILKFTPIYGYIQNNQASANYPKAGEKVEVHINSERVYPDITWSENGGLIQLARLHNDKDLLPETFYLSQNYPNPFNPNTEISFSIPNTSHVELTIYNVLGQKVITLISDQLNKGSYNVSWDGSNDDGKIVSSGMYLYRLTTDGQTLSKKMILTK